MSELSVSDYIATLDESTAHDTQVLIDMFKKISNHEPKLWNVGTLGFDTYHYKYDSGREGDATPLSFYPRKGMITVYLMDGTVRYKDMLAKLGKHTTSRVCVYIKKLSDVDLSVLEQIARESYAYVMSQDGHMHRAQE